MWQYFRPAKKKRIDSLVLSCVYNYAGRWPLCRLQTADSTFHNQCGNKTHKLHCMVSL